MRFVLKDGSRVHIASDLDAVLALAVVRERELVLTCLANGIFEIVG
mgnify:CR=1 FL=1